MPSHDPATLLNGLQELALHGKLQLEFAACRFGVALPEQPLVSAGQKKVVFAIEFQV